MAGCTETLIVDRAKLDPNFDGYKLSLDTLPIYSVDINSGVDRVKLRDDQYSYQHVRAFGTYNHLILDAWNTSNVYYVDDERRVRQLHVILENHLNQPQVVFSIPNSNRNTTSRHNVSFCFPSETRCILSDGTGTLFILNTAQRDSTNSEQWKVLFSDEVCEDKQPFMLLDSVEHFTDGIPVPVYECLLLHIKENKTSGTSKLDTTQGFVVLLEWLSLSKNLDEDAFIKVQRSRTFSGTSAPLMTALEKTGDAVVLASQTDFNIVSDSVQPINADEHEERTVDGKDEIALYTWSQTGEETILTFIIPQDTTRGDITITLAHDHIHVTLKKETTLITGELERYIDVDISSWTVEDTKLVIVLAKKELGPMWSEVVIGDSRGRYVIDADQARIIHEKLANLTSEELNASPHPDGFGPGVTPQELEDCDSCPEGCASMSRFDGSTNKVTNKVSLGSHQWLFNVTLDPRQMTCISLRHDVDGIIWQPVTPDKDNPSAWKHQATFNALGYVQAAKMAKKFASCSQDASYAVLCDCIRHLFIYRQPSPTLSPLRNRTSGRVIGELAKQQVISLDSTDDILGMQATNERLFVLTAKKLYVIRVLLTDGS